MSNILVHAHSGLRWIVLILLLAAIVKAFSGKNSGKEYGEGDRKLNLFAMISFHTQYLLGLILIFVSERMAASDYLFKKILMEHLTLMTVAFVLITIGHSKAKKAVTSKGKFAKIATFYTIALVLILAAIPWPFRTDLGGSWF
jgi:hypothetical protein